MAHPAAIVRLGWAGVNEWGGAGGELPPPHPHHVQPARAHGQQADGDGGWQRERGAGRWLVALGVGVGAEFHDCGVKEDASVVSAAP